MFTWVSVGGVGAIRLGILGTPLHEARIRLIKMKQCRVRETVLNFIEVKRKIFIRILSMMSSFHLIIHLVNMNESKKDTATCPFLYVCLLLYAEFV